MVTGSPRSLAARSTALMLTGLAAALVPAHADQLPERAPEGGSAQPDPRLLDRPASHSSTADGLDAGRLRLATMPSSASPTANATRPVSSVIVITTPGRRLSEVSYHIGAPNTNDCGHFGPSFFQPAQGFPSSFITGSLGPQ